MSHYTHIPTDAVQYNSTAVSGITNRLQSIMLTKSCPLVIRES